MKTGWNCICLAVLSLSTSAQCLLDELRPATGAAGHFFGIPAVSGNLALVGAPGNGAGSVHAFERTARGWVEVGELTASDGTAGDAFGRAVSMLGGVAVVGAPDADAPDERSGAAYVFQHTPAGWVEVIKLFASDGDANDHFGSAVSMGAGRAAVGAPQDELGGSAYAFEDGPVGWTETQKLTAGGPTEGFGMSVAVDGDTLLVGAPLESPTGFVAGAAYAFEHTGSTWGAPQRISPTNLGGTAELFGWSIDVWGDDAVIGAPWFSTTPSLFARGATFFFERTGGTWQQLDIFPGDAESDEAGYRVALTGGLALSSVTGDDGVATDAGAVRGYTRGPSGWTYAGRLTAPDAAPGAYFGVPALDGDNLLVGVPKDDDGGDDSGSLYAFSLAELGCPALLGVPDVLSAGSAGAQHFVLRAGAAHAGKVAFLLGSASGSTPGFVFGGLTVPLNPDPYLLVTLTAPNQPPLDSSLSILGGQGNGSARLFLPPGGNPGLAGSTLHHAYGVLALAPLTLVFVSNAEPLTFLP